MRAYQQLARMQRTTLWKAVQIEIKTIQER